MDAKLTLKLDKGVIDRAKNYAHAQNKSLSRIIESYLRALVNRDNTEFKDVIEISPFVKSMATGVNISADSDDRKEYGKYLNKKYK